ncbi:MAG: cyanophycinase [Anaerolineales bacterium]
MTHLMAIGGAINLAQPRILHEFYRRAGAESAHIVILPTASARPDAGQEYAELFAQFGLQQPAKILDVRTRQDALALKINGSLWDATGIFITGGNQGRITAAIGGTPLEGALHAALQRGAWIAGTSAGAAVLSAIMLAYGKSGPTPRVGMAQFTPGLGFSPNILFDQHFRQRDRIGRLLYAVAAHPGLLGVGVDENTAAILEEDTLHVLGSGALTVVDGRDITATDIADLPSGAPVALAGARVHTLTEGCRFHIGTRTPHIPPKILPID